MPTSKKQLVKLNQAKKAKAEELSKQAAAGSEGAKKSTQEKLRKDSNEPTGSSPALFCVDALFKCLQWNYALLKT